MRSWDQSSVLFRGAGVVDEDLIEDESNFDLVEVLCCADDSTFVLRTNPRQYLSWEH